MLGAGIIMAGIIGVILDITRAYKTILLLGIIGTSGAATFFTLMLKPNNIYLLTTSCAMIGMTGMALLPVSLGK